MQPELCCEPGVLLGVVMARPLNAELALEEGVEARLDFLNSDFAGHFLRTVELWPLSIVCQTRSTDPLKLLPENLPIELVIVTNDASAPFDQAEDVLSVFHGEFCEALEVSLGFSMNTLSLIGDRSCWIEPLVVHGGDLRGVGVLEADRADSHLDNLGQEPVPPVAAGLHVQREEVAPSLLLSPLLL